MPRTHRSMGIIRAVKVLMRLNAFAQLDLGFPCPKTCFLATSLTASLSTSASVHFRPPFFFKKEKKERKKETWIAKANEMNLQSDISLTPRF